MMSFSRRGALSLAWPQRHSQTWQQAPLVAAAAATRGKRPVPALVVAVPAVVAAAGAAAGLEALREAPVVGAAVGATAAAEAAVGAGAAVAVAPNLAISGASL